MKPPTATELLTVWEHSIEQPLLQKTLNLLNLAYPEIDSETIVKLSIGERDARLLSLREMIFGSRLMNTADCPKCAERVEWESDIENIRMQSLQQPSLSSEFTFKADDISIRFRLPNSIDISAVIADERPYLKNLLARCIIEAHCKDGACSLDSLPDEVLTALDRRMEEEDPQADIHIELCCPYCNYRWEIQFDIVSYLWSEIDNWAEHMLLAVNELARTYGWSEHDILNMSPVRRQLYLGFVNS